MGKADADERLSTLLADAGYRCECTRRIGESFSYERCDEMHMQRGRSFKGFVILSIVEVAGKEHVYCQRCAKEMAGLVQVAQIPAKKKPVAENQVTLFQEAA